MESESLKLRMEINKSLGNLRTKLLQCFYNGRSVAENYLNGDTELHVHWLSSNDCFCATHRRAIDHWRTDGGEMPVFVRVGNLSQSLSPFASLVRLNRQLLWHEHH